MNREGYQGLDGPIFDEASVREFKVELLPALGFPTRPISGSRGMVSEECGCWMSVSCCNEELWQMGRSFFPHPWRGSFQSAHAWTYLEIHRQARQSGAGTGVQD